MDPIQAINVLSQVVKTARLPYNEHVVLERCVDVLTQAVWNFTTDASGNWTLNIRGDGSNSLDSIMDTGESLTIAHIVKQGGTAYYNSAVQVDGSSITPEWQGGAAPSAGNINSLDVYTYTIIKTGSATFTALASQTQFA